MLQHAFASLALALAGVACTAPAPVATELKQAAWQETEIRNSAPSKASSSGFDQLLAPGLWSTIPKITGDVGDSRGASEEAFVIDFSQLVSEAEFAQYDSALYSLELDTAGSTQHWFMELQVVQPIATGTGNGRTGKLQFDTSATIGERNFTYTSRLFAAEVRLWDEVGELLGTTVIHVPHLISAGMLDLSLLIDDPNLFQAMSAGEQLPAGVAEKMGHSFSTLVSLFTLIQENDLFADLLWDAVEKPSILSVIKNFGVVLSLSPKFKDQVKLPAPGADTPWHELSDEPHFALPIDVHANGTLAANIDLYITTPRPPLAICGGILALVTHHPTRDVTMRMNLIGARMAASSGESTSE